jgi:transcriptional antiterminator Rof (Rho-off)
MGAEVVFSLKNPQSVLKLLNDIKDKYDGMVVSLTTPITVRYKDRVVRVKAEGKTLKLTADKVESVSLLLLLTNSLRQMGLQVKKTDVPVIIPDDYVL